MKHFGFNLIELLLVLSIIGILLAIAVPNYSHHLVQERRLAAETELLRLAGLMEAFYTQYNTYEGATFAQLEASESIAQNNYRLVIQSQSATGFELAAIPQNQQAERDARCGS